MKSNILILLIISIFTSCSINHYKTDFEKIKNEFDTHLIDHFPKTVKGSYILNMSSLSSMKMFNKCGVTLLVYEENNNVVKLKKDCLAKAKQILDPDKMLSQVNISKKNI
ncbi:MAG: hypothetical protein HY738_06020 [Bacteroidia bacterium]|nr:hypothetical protein [Bacteroidia bacterium]